MYPINSLPRLLVMVLGRVFDARIHHPLSFPKSTRISINQLGRELVHERGGEKPRLTLSKTSIAVTHWYEKRQKTALSWDASRTYGIRTAIGIQRSRLRRYSTRDNSWSRSKTQELRLWTSVQKGRNAFVASDRRHRSGDEKEAQAPKASPNTTPPPL